MSLPLYNILLPSPRIVYNAFVTTAGRTIIPFDDVPTIDEVKAVIADWQKPGLPDGIRHFAPVLSGGGVVKLASSFKESLAGAKNLRYRSQLEAAIAGWLYDLVRANVKRGRVFDMGEVLKEGKADCLGYAKLFTLLGRLFGLDAGVIEVLVDNAGRYVPHTAVLVRLTGRRRIVDLWYGSENIRHRRLGLRVRQGETWKIRDLELKGLGDWDEVCYLPDICIDGITLYIRGNRHLKSKGFQAAVRCYSLAMELYPGNARFFYNRAIAYENLGQPGSAVKDYEQALSSDAALIRILATEHAEVTSLLDLDDRKIGGLAQEIYLLRRGFATGRKVPLAGVARKSGLSEIETEAILSLVEARLAAGFPGAR